MAEFNEEMQGFEESDASCSGNTGSSSSNIPEFMRNPPFQKGIVGFFLEYVSLRIYWLCVVFLRMLSDYPKDYQLYQGAF